MRYHLLIILLAYSITALAIDNLIYLECEPSMSVPKITFVATIDLDSKLVTFPMHHSEEKYKYKITQVSTEKIYATRKEPIGESQLIINRITGNWQLKSPIDKQYNKNFRNPEAQKFDYPTDAQLAVTTTGVCKNTKPMF